MLLFPPFLGGALLQGGLLGKAALPLSSFCLASSATYVLNDMLDAQNDARHPVKCSRPIPAGVVPKQLACLMSLFLAAAAILLGYAVSRPFTAILVCYLLISFSYSYRLKEVPLVDIFCVSSGFLLRLLAGGEAFRIAVSEWLFLSVFLLSVFLSTGKRLCEQVMLGETAGAHRKSLERYPHGFLEGTMYLTGGAVLVTYAMYAISRHALVYTVPLCTFGLLRYIMRVKTGQGGDPTESLLRDAPLFATGGLWAVLVGWGIYGG